MTELGTSALRMRETERSPAKPREAGQSKQGSRTPRKNSTKQSGARGSADEIARLKEVIVRLQSEREKNEGSDCISDLRWKLNQSEKEKLQLATKYNEEVSQYESHVAKLRAQLERGEAQRQNLEYEIAVARKDASLERSSAEDRVASVREKNEHLRVQNAELQQRASDLEKALQITQQARDEDQSALQAELEERDRLLQTANTDAELLAAEKSRLEAVLQEQEDTLLELHGRLSQAQRERDRDAEALRRRANELEHSADREERLMRELETATQRVKSLEESVESERAAHLESKFNSEIVQLRIRDLEAALQVEKAGQAEALSSLELVRTQFREVEKAYEREKDRAAEALDRLRQLEKEQLSTQSRLGEEVEEKGRELAALSERLQTQERLAAEAREEAEAAQRRQAGVEEAYGGCVRELEGLWQLCGASGPGPAVQPGEQGKLSPSVLLESLRRTLVFYQEKLRQTVNDLEDVTQRHETAARDCKSQEDLICAQRRDAEEARASLAAATTEINLLRSACADGDSRAARAQTELQSARRRWEAERARAAEAEREIHKLTQVYQQDSQEKLTFLHDLYQRLVAGCVLIKQPGGLLGRFSWPELRAVLQEQTDAVTSDLSRANEKISHLEFVCQSKSAAVAELQQTQEHTFSKLAEQLREREAAWQKQRRDLEQHYSSLTGEVQARAQKWHRAAEEAQEKASGLEQIRDQMALDLARSQKLLSGARREGEALLAACALLAGALCPLSRQLRSLSRQKTRLLEQVGAGEMFRRQIQTLLLALTAESETHEPPLVQGRPAGRMAGMFRSAAITVIALHRFRRLGRDCPRLFTWTRGFGDLPALAVCAGGVTSAAQWPAEGKQAWRSGQARRWLTSRDLLTAVLSSMAELLDTMSKTDASSPSTVLLSAAQSSFAKLMQRLDVEMEGGGLDWQGEQGGLSSRLGQGLHSFREKMLKAGVPTAMTNEDLAASLKQHMLEFMRRLHAAEVERRGLRVELGQLKRALKELKKEAERAQGVKVAAQAAGVPLQRFDSVCQELHSALQREQQAQTLLQDQARQLHDLGLRLELHSGEEAEKDRTLSQAVQSLSEAKTELRRKDQSLRQLGKHLSQLEQDKRQLQQSIRDAESALRMAAKSKDSLASYMKAVESSLKQVKERLSLSSAAADRDCLALQVPRVHLDVPGAEGLVGGPEVAACQSFISSFVDLYQLACSKMAQLESEVSSHRSHITVLKAELQSACLRENQEDLFPISGATVGVSSTSPPNTSPQPGADAWSEAGNSRPGGHSAANFGPLRVSRGGEKTWQSGPLSSGARAAFTSSTTITN
ncbi:coiled-coil domain-containing protein 171 [Amia ocellicauda]|uniref:coiled-coil domain-containing protein 171 n=1 Tax=Amia ocellicauda TaxID=2972642 RepID=UPI003463863E